MKVYCIEEFKVEFEKVHKNKKYGDLETLILDYFFNKTISEIATGDLLNGSDKTPFLKKRLPDSSGYRIYFYVIVKDENIYLTFLHPKIGPYGSANIDPKYLKYIQKQTYQCIVQDTLYELSKCPTNGTLKFEVKKNN